MATVHTELGDGEIVASETTRGRTHYKVAGRGFEFWMDETEVNLRTAGAITGAEGHDHPYGEDNRCTECGAHFAEPHDPGCSSDPEGDHHVAARGFDFEPSLHTWDNETTLPYNPHDGQYPVDMFRHEQTQSPDHKLDVDKRLRPTKSVSGEPGAERPKKAPAAHLFAKQAAGMGYPSHGGAEADWEDAYPDPEHDLHHGPQGSEQHRHEDMWSPQEISELKGHQGHTAGMSAKYIPLRRAPHADDLIARFRTDPVGTIKRTGAIDLDAGLDREVGEDQLFYANADKRTIEAAWSDVARKAKRLRHEGRVDVQDISYDRIYAKVAGDHGTYDTMIAKGGDYGQVGQGISNWRCSCDWGKWAFKRQFTFVGRLCSHGYAAYQEMQSRHIKEDKNHPFQQRRQQLRKRASDDNEGEPKDSLANFKKWVKDENEGHFDLDAADRYMATAEDPMDKELAQQVYDYAAGHHSERPERDFDQDDYNFDNDEAYKTADVLRTQPRKLTPDSIIVPVHEGEDAHYFTDLGDDRETTGPGQIQASAWLTAKEAGEHHPAFAWHDDEADDFPESGIVHFSNRWFLARPGDPGDPDTPLTPNFGGGMTPGGGAPQGNVVAPPPPGPTQQDAVSAYTGVPAPGGGTPGGPQPAPAASAADNVAAPGQDNGPHGAPGSGRNPTPGDGGAGSHEQPGMPKTTPAPQGPGGAGSWSGGGAGGGSYTVKPGDTLSGIAQSSGGNLADIEKANSGAMGSGTNIGQNPNLIHPGDTLKGVGGGSSAAPSASSGWGLGGTPAGKASTGWGLGGTPAGQAAEAPKAPATGGIGSSALTGSPGKIPSIPLGGGAMSGIHANRQAQLFAARYFQADDGLDSTGDDKRKQMPAAGAPVGAGTDYKSTAPSGGAPKLPAGDNGVSSQTNSGNGPTGTWVQGPHGPVDTSGQAGVGATKQQSQSGGGTGGDAAAGGAAGPLKTNPLGGGGNASGIADQIGPIAGGIAQGIGSMVPGLSGIMNEVGPLVSGLGHMFGSNEAQRFAMRYFEADGNFLGDGGADWADYPFAGSGPSRKDWIGSSEDYVEENERPNRQETWVTDNDGDVVKYTKERPRQRPKQAAVDHFAFERAAGSPGPDTGYYNPANRPYQEDDSDQYQPEKNGKGGKPGGPPGEGGPSAGDAAGVGEAGGELGELGELAPLLVAAGNENAAMGLDGEVRHYGTSQDQSDIVRQFQASQAAAGLMGKGGSDNGGGAYSDDAIAGAAQAFLAKQGGMRKTAGRVFSQAEQRALEDEAHPQGARNLGSLDLSGTHYQ